MEKRNLHNTVKQKAAMINALEGNFGSVAKATKVVGISPRTHYRWLNEDNDYARQAENMKDICYRRVKDNLLESALKKIEEGDSAVLNKMLGIYFKKLPEEMERVSHYNDVPFKFRVKVAPHPTDMFSKDPMTQLAVKRYMDDKEKDGKLCEIRQDLVKKYKEGKD